jgi:hypothetical protein
MDLLKQSDANDMAQELLARAVKRELVGIMIMVDPESGKLQLMGLNADMEDMVSLILEALDSVKKMYKENMHPDRTLQ